MNLMLTITQGRTLERFGEVHYCSKHKVIEDKNHLKQCDLINHLGDPTRFNRMLREEELCNLPVTQLNQLL